MEARIRRGLHSLTGVVQTERRVAQKESFTGRLLRTEAVLVVVLEMASGRIARNRFIVPRTHVQPTDSSLIKSSMLKVVDQAQPVMMLLTLEV